MRISERERSYIRRYISIADRQSDSDLFREAEVSAGRKRHLVFVIRRKAGQLGITAPADLESRDEAQLNSIRRDLSKQIARLKSASSSAEEMAA